jgi:anti-sigma regulatory factor (Ser/Thr protein kinase)
LAVPTSAAKARQAVSLFSTLHGFSGDELCDIETAVGEAVANAIEHGNRERGSFTVSCAFERGTLTIEICDSGAGFDVSPRAPEPTERRTPSTRGYGISIMRSLMSRVAFKNGGSTVVLEKRYPGATAASSGNCEATS